MVDAESEQFSLRWNNFHSNLTAGFHAFLQGEDLVDVTLAAGGQFVQAHKIVLSVCSPYFKDLFKINPCKHPIVILKDVGHKELAAILDFMYQGEVNVRQEDLATFLKTAEMLQIKGLTGDDSAATNTSSSVPNPSERTPPRQPAPVTSVLEPLVVQAEETPVRPYKRMRTEVPAPPQPPSLPPVKPPPLPPIKTPSSSHSVSSPCTVNEDTSGIDFVEITKPKEEPVEYESDIEEIDCKVPSREDPLVQLLTGGESSSQSHQDTSQGGTPSIFASIPGLSQDSGGSQEGGQGVLVSSNPRRQMPDTGSVQAIVVGDKFACSICYKCFKRKNALTAHHRNIHGELQGPFACMKCGQLSKNKNSLKTHMYGKHGGQY